jgi:pimeloyl-ACP methyl ester carboxylesterase
MTELSEHPVTTDVPDPTGTPVVVDGNALAASVHRLILTNRSGEVPRLIHLTAEGDLGPVIALILEAAREPDPGSQAMFWTIMCSEPWATFRPASVAAFVGDSYFAEPVLQDARSYRFACGFVEPGVVMPEDREPVRSDVPVLLLNGSEDPQDPPANVADAATELPNSLEVVAPGQGHTVGHLGCLPAVVSAFVEAGTADGLDTTCVAGLDPPSFMLGTG